MDSGAHKLLESATHRTLHSHSFSRSSSQASLVLTDLLSRYLTLLSETCARYAQHAGRTNVTARDALGALDELGVSVDELNEYCSSEGKELARYAIHSTRRVEDLNEFKGQLSDGLRQDRNDAIRLYFSRYTTPPFDDSEDGDESEDGENMGQLAADESLVENRMNIDMPLLKTLLPGRHEDSSQLATPSLPLTPISNYSPPLRKPPRTSSWQPPPHVPDFLPPFPSTTDTPPSPIVSYSPQPAQFEPPPVQIGNVAIEKPPISLSQALTSSSASDYLVQVPYSQSSLSTVAEWHLPSSLPAPAPIQTRHLRLPTPQTEPALFAAYHHILTHPPPPNTHSPTPSRHKVAMALLSQTQATPRWEPPDTLYSSVAPCLPRVPTIGPTFPIAIGSLGADSKARTDGKERDFKFPPTTARPVSSNERLTPLISQQPSRIPDLARHVLPPAILARTSRLTHPPVLQRGPKLLVYGAGVPASWNANALPSAEMVPPTPGASKVKDGHNGLANGMDRDSPVKPVLPDARLYATWDYEPKDFKVPLAPTSRNRGRMGSIQGSSGVISLALGTRGKSGSKVG